MRGEIVKMCPQTTWLFEIEVGVHANTLVMPGLDPGIHPSSQEVLSKRMDCRVKPGNDSSNLLRQIIHLPYPHPHVRKHVGQHRLDLLNRHAGLDARVVQ